MPLAAGYVVRLCGNGTREDWTSISNGSNLKTWSRRGWAGCNYQHSSSGLCYIDCVVAWMTVGWVRRGHNITRRQLSERDCGHARIPIVMLRRNYSETWLGDYLCIQSERTTAKWNIFFLWCKNVVEWFRSKTYDDAVQNRNNFKGDV